MPTTSTTKKTFTQLWRDDQTGVITEGNNKPAPPKDRYPYKEFETVSNTTWDLIVEHQPPGRVLHVYAAIMRALKPNDLRIYVTQKAIAESLGMGPNEVSTAFRKLQEMGLILKRKPRNELAYWLINKDHAFKGSARAARQAMNEHTPTARLGNIHG